MGGLGRYFTSTESSAKPWATPCVGAWWPATWLCPWTRPGPTRRRCVSLYGEGVARVLKAAHGSIWYVAFHMALYIGLRRSEVWDSGGRTWT